MDSTVLPSTGDSGNMFLWAMLLAATGIIIIATVLYARKRS